MDWQDLKWVWTLSRSGRLKDAGAALKVDPTTLSRRITALETALGEPLFVRAGGEWTLTEAGKIVVEGASQMVEIARELRHRLEVNREQITGVVRLTTLPYIVSHFLVPHLPRLYKHHPGIVMDFRCTEQLLDLEAGQSDIALRLLMPKTATLRVMRLLRIELGLYGRGDRFAVGEDRMPLITTGPPNSTLAEARWLSQLCPNSPVLAGVNDFSVQLELIRAGLGVGILPVRVASPLPELLRLDPATHPLERSLYRVVPESIADIPRIRAVLDWLEGCFLVGL